MKISLVLMLRKEKLRFVTRLNSHAMCMIKIFFGGGLEVVYGDGVIVKDASSGVVGVGVIKTCS